MLYNFVIVTYKNSTVVIKPFPIEMSNEFSRYVDKIMKSPTVYYWRVIEGIDRTQREFDRHL